MILVKVRTGVKDTRTQRLKLDQGNAEKINVPYGQNLGTYNGVKQKVTIIIACFGNIMTKNKALDPHECEVRVVAQYQLDSLFDRLGKLPFDPIYTVSIVKWEPNRSLAQNSLIHKHFGELEEQDAGEFLQVKSYCKLVHGVPIMQTQKAIKYNDWCREWDRLTTKYELTYEGKLEFLRILPLTSLMSMRMKTAFIKSYMFDFESQGYELTHPRDHFDEMERRFV